MIVEASGKDGKGTMLKPHERQFLYQMGCLRKKDSLSRRLRERRDLAKEQQQRIRLKE
jgi:hypothetical protein